MLLKSTRGPIECYLCPEAEQQTDTKLSSTSRFANFFQFILTFENSSATDKSDTAGSKPSQTKFLPFSPISEQGRFLFMTKRYHSFRLFIHSRSKRRNTRAFWYQLTCVKTPLLLPRFTDLVDKLSNGDFSHLFSSMADESMFDLYWRHFDMTREEWIGWCLLSFHATHFCKWFQILHYSSWISVLLWLCWRHESAQMVVFTLLGGLMLAAEKINELLAQQQWLSRQNYFDSS